MRKSSVAWVLLVLAGCTGSVSSEATGEPVIEAPAVAVPVAAPAVAAPVAVAPIPRPEIAMPIDPAVQGAMPTVRGGEAARQLEQQGGPQRPTSLEAP